MNVWIRVAAAAVASLTLIAVTQKATGSGPPPDPVAADGAVVQRAAPAHHDSPSVALAPTGDGHLVVDRSRPGVGTGPETTYTVEVDPALRDQAAALALTVATALDDTAHGWARSTRLRQVADPQAATVRILLAEPAVVDGLCAQAGYATNGQFSCWNGRFAALNSLRWFDGAAGFASLAQYRRYQVNHEVGHGLGHAHEYCAGPGQLAPLMMQQSKGLLGCRPNPLPVP